MVRKSLFTFLMLALMGYVSAQSFQVEQDGVAVAEGQTVVCTYVEEWGEYVEAFHVRNLSSSNMSIVTTIEPTQELDGADVYFCWGSCNLPGVYESRPVEVPAATLSNEDLSVHVLFNDAVGCILVKVNVFNADDPTDKLTFVVQFANDGTGFAENPAQCNMSHAYPNPASSMVRFNYDLSSASNAAVTVYNLLGQEVMSERLNGLQGQVAFSVADLNEGIYFCNLMVNGQVMKTEKFIVKK